MRQGYQDLKFDGRKVPFFNTIQAALDYADEKNSQLTTENGDGPLVFIHSGTYTGEFLVIDCDVSLIGKFSVLSHYYFCLVPVNVNLTDAGFTKVLLLEMLRSL